MKAPSHRRRRSNVQTADNQRQNLLKELGSAKWSDLVNYEAFGLKQRPNIQVHKARCRAPFRCLHNFVRQHHTLGTTPAVAAGLEEKPCSLEQVVEMTAAYMGRKEDATVRTGKRSPSRP
jgi:hypothetical protein